MLATCDERRRKGQIIMNNLFANQTEVIKQGGANQLAITAQLTSKTDSLAKALLTTLLADVEANGATITNSQTDSDALDNLILSNIVVNEEVAIDDLKYVDADVLEKALKSQQSKRSRAKGAPMTEDNYIKLLSAAIAEHAIRLAMGKPKNSGGRISAGVTELTEEQIETYKADQALLGKAIRNVQSKKSIYKGKADFNAEGDYWASLVALETQLKSLRSNTTTVVTEEAQQAIEANEKASSLLTDVDPKALKADEAKKLLAELQEALAARN